jgi:methionyl-tRNA formyltransferase
MLLQRELEIGPAETAPELARRLSEAGAPLMVETLRGLAAGTIAPRLQDHSKATLAPILKKEDGRIVWTRTAQEVYNRMRGFTPWPGAYTALRGQTCHVWGGPVSKEGGAGLSLDVAGAAPGTLFVEGKNVLVSCGGTTFLRIITVKREGRKEVSALEFANGARLKTGERFDDA